MLVYQRATAGENFKVHFLPQGVSTKWLQITLQTGKLMYFSGGSDKRNIDLGMDTLTSQRGRSLLKLLACAAGSAAFQITPLGASSP